MNLITQCGLRGLVLLLGLILYCKIWCPLAPPYVCLGAGAVSKGNFMRTVELVNDSYVCHSPQVSVTRYTTSD